MRIVSGSSSCANRLNAGRVLSNIVMDYDVYLELKKNGFRPNDFFRNNKVKILIELNEEISKNIEDIKVAKKTNYKILYGFANRKSVINPEYKRDDLLYFTGVEYEFEKEEFEYKIQLDHKETGSISWYVLKNIDPLVSLEDLVIEFYCHIKKISTKEFDKRFSDFLNKANIPKTIRAQSELDNERLTEIVDAIVRYRKSEMAVPTEWIQEYNTIIERIKNNPK